MRRSGPAVAPPTGRARVGRSAARGYDTCIHRGIAIAKRDASVARRLAKFLRERIAPLDDPRSAGKALVGEEKPWRYRIGDLRLVVSIEDAALRILAIRIGHRREVYR